MFVTFQGKFEKAETLFKRLVSMSESKRGLDHAAVAADLNNLAEVLKKQVGVERML